MSIPPYITGYRSRVINAIIDALRRHRPIPGPGLLASQGPGGTVLSLAKATSSGVAAAPDDLPWTATIYHDEDLDTWSVTFSNCGYVRGPVTRILPNQIFTLDDPPEAGAGNYWIGVKINTETGDVDANLLCSIHADDVYDTTPPNDQFFKRLLYTFTYVAANPSTDTPSSWTIKSNWYRLLPELGAYV